MNRHPVRLTAQVVLASIVLASTASPLLSADANWHAGSARVCITPDQFMWMAGYGFRSHPAEGKFRDLWAKSLVLQDSKGKQGVIISLDLVGIDSSFAELLCDELERRFEFHRDQVAICVTHTHTGPVVGRCLAPLHYLQVDKRQQNMIDEYAKQLQQKVTECVSLAIDDMEPCTLRHGSGHATFAVNRRNNSEPKVPALREANELKGPVDHDVPVLAVRTIDGHLKTILFGYACHATVLRDYMWSGDYPGFAEQNLESTFPDCVAMFWAGCGADQNPLPRRTLELAQQYGSRLAQSVHKVLDTQMQPINGRLKTRFKFIPLRLDKLPSERELINTAESNNQYIHACRDMRLASLPLGHPKANKPLRSVDRFVRARAEMLLEQTSHGQPLADTYPFPIGVWSIGDQVQFVFLGGEVVVDFAIRAKSEMSGTNTWVSGYANDVMAYIPSERVLREGGYEGASAMIYYGLPTSWKPGLEKDIIDTIHTLAETTSVTAQ